MSNDRYLVTARRYRPQKFADLVSQEHVSETLKNAIRLNRLAHAYLFSGPRGVGKTTSARILAKAINCETPLAEREDQAEPCGKCPSCRSFEENRSLSIIEIDAASNNKVEDVQNLRETIRIPPQGAKKKVYIIDEVHMLSNAAFNALLKTLEEPPPHVLFIFATTEPNKVLPTILSRCQRFDLRRIAVPEVVERLREICLSEGIEADEESLMLVARKGDGSLRDALSAFDQAVSLCGTTLRYAELTQALGVVDVDLYFEVTRLVAGQHHAAMLLLVDRIVRSGYDLQEFLNGLAEHLRNLLVTVTMRSTELVEGTENLRARYAAEAPGFTEPDLLRLLKIVSDAEEHVKGSPQPRLRLEMSLLQMTSMERAADLRRLLQKLDQLEAIVREGGVATIRELPRSEPARPPAAPQQAAPPEPSAPDRLLPREPARPALRPVRPAEPAPPPAPEAEEEPAPAPLRPVEPPRPAPAAPGLFGTPALRSRKPAPPEAGPERREPGEPQDAAFEGSGALARAPQRLSDAALRQIEQQWPAFLRQVKSTRIHVGALLQHAVPSAVEGGRLLLQVPDEFHQRLLGSQEEFLVRILSDTLQKEAPALAFVVQQPLRQVEAEAAEPEPDPVEQMQRLRRENPIIRAIVEQFGGEVVW